MYIFPSFFFVTYGLVNLNKNQMIPSVRRKEWRELVLKPVSPKLLSHSFRFKLSSIKRKIKSGRISQEQGIKELISECEAHYDLYKNDLHQIFNE